MFWNYMEKQVYRKRNSLWPQQNVGWRRALCWPWWPTDLWMTLRFQRSESQLGWQHPKYLSSLCFYWLEKVGNESITVRVLKRVRGPLPIILVSALWQRGSVWNETSLAEKLVGNQWSNGQIPCFPWFFSVIALFVYYLTFVTFAQPKILVYRESWA